MATTEPDTPASSPADTIAAYQRKLNQLGSRQAGHLCCLAISAVKYLILEGSSDVVRLQAVKLMLELPPVRQKLEMMSARAKRVSQERGQTDQLLELVKKGGEPAERLVLEALSSSKKSLQ